MSQFVSLGGNCAVAYNLKKINLYNNSFPFDWCKLNLKKLLKVFENNLEKFENIEFKKKSYNHKIIGEKLTEIDSLILRNNYGIEFAHEICNKYEINEFKKKIISRIEKFRNLENPIFIRLETENLSDEKMQLYETLEILLNKYFDNFQIILISKNKYESKFTRWIELETFSEDWRFPEILWNEILIK